MDLGLLQPDFAALLLYIIIIIIYRYIIIIIYHYSSNIIIIVIIIPFLLKPFGPRKPNGLNFSKRLIQARPLEGRAPQLIWKPYLIFFRYTVILCGSDLMSLDLKKLIIAVF